jgi:hypothetical protein
MAAISTTGVLGNPGRMLPATPTHITNNAITNPMICSALTVEA